MFDRSSTLTVAGPCWILTSFLKTTPAFLWNVSRVTPIGGEGKCGEGANGLAAIGRGPAAILLL